MTILYMTADIKETETQKGTYQFRNPGIDIRVILNAY